MSIGTRGAGLAPVHLEILLDGSASRKVKGRCSGLLQELY